MDRAGLLGVSWRHATSASIARYTLPRDARASRLRDLARGLEVEELVFLATCNRVEVLFAGGANLSIAVRRRRLHAHFCHGQPSAEPAERMIRAWEGEGMVEHLFLVAAGLDSARVGEAEVTGQLRAAMAEASTAGLLGHRLQPLLAEALGVARRVRPLTEGHVGRASLADIAVDAVRAHLSHQPGRVALVGVSAMTERAGVALRREGIRLVMVNRTLPHAAPLAAQLNAELRGLDAFRDAPSDVSAVVLATSASAPIFDDAALKRMAAGSAPLLVDFGVPPNIDGDAAQRAGLAHLGMDALTQMAQAERNEHLEALGEARAAVDAALESRRRRAWESAVDPAILELRRRYAAQAEAAVSRVLRHELAGLGVTEREAVRRMSSALARQFAHLPSRGLRDLAAQAGPEAAAAFLGTAAPDLADDVRLRARALPRQEEFA